MSIDQLPPDNLELDETAVVGAMRDLERLVRGRPVAEIPPAEDAALFDALAEYDRLAAISRGLEHRKDVFRPGVPEAERATKNYDAAYDEAAKAWARARDIPATTQAGIIAKLQGAVRFVTELGEDELFEDEWRAVKADVLNLGVRDPGHLAEGGSATRSAPVDAALDGLADSLSMVGTARHALGTILEDRSGHPGEQIGFCILRTLDSAIEQGEASFDIVWKAMKGKTV